MKAAYESCRHISMNTKQKAEFDLVTDLDYSVEKILTAKIHENFPEDKLIAEEFSANKLTEERTWSVDPIDGTVNMANGIPMYGMQCSLLENKKPVAAAIYHPVTGDMICAADGEGTYVNGQRSFVNSDVALSNAVISFADFSHWQEKLAVAETRAIAHIYPVVAKIRLFGCASCDFGFVAMGKTSGTVIVSKNVWDLAPGYLVCREAGAHLCELNGKPFDFGHYKGLIACANEELKELMVEGFGLQDMVI